MSVPDDLRADHSRGMAGAVDARAARGRSQAVANQKISIPVPTNAFGPDGRGRVAQPGEYTLLDIDGAEERGVAYLTDDAGEWYCVQRSSIPAHD
jgi:hypothetical protein